MGVTTQADRVEAFTKAFDGICRHVHQAVQGGDEVVRLVVTAFLSSGHLLIEDVPGVGKTTLAKALAATVGGTFGRIQFTPDLMPSDVVGTAVYFIGEVGISGDEILVFNIDVEPVAGSGRRSVQFKREFFGD